MKVGDRVRVVGSLNVYHHPEHPKQAFDIQGMEGEIVDILADWHGRPISPNYPVLIKFQANPKGFNAHLGTHEIEVVS